MALKFYNTLTRKKDVFEPIKEGYVGLYSCGPTVYNYAHIGNFRAYVASDILKRYLLFKGYEVKHVMNITDVDDKTIRDSKKQGISLKEFTRKYEKAFFEDLEKLNILNADIFPRATEHIKEMTEMIKKLIEKGFAYKAKDGIYYNIRKFKDYGKLSKINIDNLKAFASERIAKDEYDKENINDFALWKFWTEDDGNVFWETELGKGRPGWHIECSAMSTKYLGNHFDIHTGGVDLIFPHHENEIAQSEAANNEKFVNYWLHNEYILVNNQKMSKSKGNFFTLRDLLDRGYNALAIRYLLLSSNYRQKLNFTFEGIESAEKSILKIMEFIERVKAFGNASKNNSNVDDIIKKAKQEFINAMDDDLNTSLALAAIFGFIKDVNKEIDSKGISGKNADDIIGLMKDFDKVIGVMHNFFNDKKIPDDIVKLAEERLNARKNKDWELADKLRQKIISKGYLIDDTKDSYVLKKA